MKKFSSKNVEQIPYPHIVINDFTGLGDVLSNEFPPLDLFGKEVRMDGDMFSQDDNFKSYLQTSSNYKSLIDLLTSKKLITELIKSFDSGIQAELDSSEMLIDPRGLEIVSEALEDRSGRPIDKYDSPKIFSRVDIGFGGKGYGVKNGGKGIHIDNRKRLFSCLLYLNEPNEMIGGEHRLYSLDKNYKFTEKQSYPVKQDLFVGSLQSNFAFHDVNPIIEIDGYRKAIYVGITCTHNIWAPIRDAKQAELSQNRPVPTSLFKRIINKLK
jgi:hypothetical protein